MSKKRASYDNIDPLHDRGIDPLELIVPTQTKRQTRKKDKEQKKNTRQMSVLLYEEQIEWLNGALKRIKAQGNRNINKAQIIRAMLDLIMENNIDFTGVISEEEIKIRFKQTLSR